MSEYELRPVSMDDAAIILNARNSDAVRRHMCGQHDIGWEEHESWLKRRIASVAHAPYCLLSYRGEPTGVVGISRYDEATKSGEWGFYLCSQKAPKGTGTLMLAAFCELVFTRCKMQRLESKVKAGNAKSLHLHHKLGFVDMASKEADIYAFYLDAKKWKQQRTAFERMIEHVTMKEFA